MLNEKLAAKALSVLPRGAFLTTTAHGKTNTMTIGWGNIGIIWGKPIFTVLVRPSRYTYDLLEASTEFTVSLPQHDMQAALALCGSKSGRDMDKIAAAGLGLQSSKTVTPPVIAGADLHYECKIVYKQAMLPEALAADLQGKMYPQGDYHTLYFGEITAVYED